MSPRILEVSRCPHCKAVLERPTPRVCPSCGGSIQKRYLSAGCLTSAPPPVILFALLALATGKASCGARARGEEARAASAAGDARGAERIALPARRP